MATKLRVLDLFSGIGGFSLGLERSGMVTVGFCEILPFPMTILKKHWPDVPIFKDIRSLTGDEIFKTIGTVDVICGGFPCQDISGAGKRKGITGERSGLWKEYARLIGEIRPSWTIIENVSALQSRGLVTVLQDLCEVGYDAEWHCIPASYVGAPHRRDRIWIVAYPKSLGKFGEIRNISGQDAAQQKPEKPQQNKARKLIDAGVMHGILANTNCARLEIGPSSSCNSGKELSPIVRSCCDRSTFWESEPQVDRVVDGFPGRVDRVKALGNAVVPQIAEMIGRAIIQRQQ